MDSLTHKLFRRIRRSLMHSRLPRNPFPVPVGPYYNTIFVIGDSHVSLFGGRDIIQPIWPAPALDNIAGLRTIHLGPSLAFSLNHYGCTALGRERLEAVLTFLPSDAKILLSFGEIDCRAHLLKKCPSPDQLSSRLEACRNSLMQTALRLKKLGKTVSIYNIIPSTSSVDWNDEQYPVRGTCLERNAATRELNRLLKASCEANQIGFLSTFDQFVDSQNLTNPSWFMDAVHLSQRALPLTLSVGHEIFNPHQNTLHAKAQD